MSEDLQMNIALMCGFIVFIFSFIKVFLKGKSLKQRFIEKANQGGHITEGICVNTKRIHGNRKSKSQYNKYDKLVVKYEFVVNGYKYY